MLRKPLKDCLHQWVQVSREGKPVLLGFDGDGRWIQTSPLVAFSPPQRGAPGMAETQNSFYALGEPKTK